MSAPLPPEFIPVFEETIVGALIDSARISVGVALSLQPTKAAPLIVVPGDEEALAAQAANTVDGCLEQAMQWLDAARVLTVQAGAPVTSLHTVGGGRPG